MPSHRTRNADAPTPQPRLGTQPLPGTSGDEKYRPRIWGSNGIGDIEDLTVPSGQLCAVRRPGLEGLLREGILHNLDVLTGIVTETHLQDVKTKGVEAARDSTVIQTQALQDSLLANPQKFAELIHVVDRVVCAVVVQPDVKMTPNSPVNRKQGVIYCDMIDLNDKMFIFNYAVGGTRDLEQFRKDTGDALGGVESGEQVGSEA